MNGARAAALEIDEKGALMGDHDISGLQVPVHEADDRVNQRQIGEFFKFRRQRFVIDSHVQVSV